MFVLYQHRNNIFYFASNEWNREKVKRFFFSFHFWQTSRGRQSQVTAVVITQKFAAFDVDSSDFLWCWFFVKCFQFTFDSEMPQL